jgi:hypothetical protein
MREILLHCALAIVCVVNAQESPPPAVQAPGVAPPQQVPPPPLYQPPPIAQPQPPLPIPMGAVLVSRNNDERLNTSLGYWNHLAIYDAATNTVIESQAGIGVQAVPWSVYRARPQRVLVVFPRTPELGQAAVLRARSRIGTPYWRLSSVVLFPRPFECGSNCVTLIDDAYGVRLRRPDNIFWCTAAFATTAPPQYQQPSGPVLPPPQPQASL